MANAIDTSTVESIDREISTTIRKLAWLQHERDILTGFTKGGPRGPKGPTPNGRIALNRRPLSISESKIVEACKGWPDDEWTVPELIDETKMNRNTLVCAMTTVVRDGYVHRVRHGRYQLNSELGMIE